MRSRSAARGTTAGSRRCRRCRRRRSSARRASRCSAFAAALQLSIAAADILLTIAALLWVGLLVKNQERIEVPRMFWPLAAYAGATLVASVFSVDPRVSLVDSKQLVLLIIVPLAYRLFRGRRALLAVDVIITIGAVSATWGIVQYLILNYDNLGRRPQGALGLYMTYSGLLMLVACAAVSRVMFAKHHRAWAALVLPALVLALVVHLHAQRLGRRLRRDRAALPAARLPADRAAAGGAGGVPGAGAVRA